MCDGKKELLIKNPIDRYLINSPMLPNLKENPDGSLTIYPRKDSLGKALESNRMPARKGSSYIVLPLHWPKMQPPSILPPGK